MERVFVIAEAGVNHNGSIDLAFRLIDAAKDTGADAIKFSPFARPRWLLNPLRRLFIRSERHRQVNRSFKCCGAWN